MPTVEILASNLLISAIRIGNIETVHTILANGVEINASAGLDPSKTAFLTAVEKEDIHLLQLLLDAGADPNMINIVPKRTAIEEAVFRNASIMFVQKLIEAGTDANVPFINTMF